jgi:hypothetical protein
MGCAVDGEAHREGFGFEAEAVREFVLEHLRK